MDSANSLDGCLSAAGSLTPSRCIQVGATPDRPDYQKQGKSLHRRLRLKGIANGNMKLSITGAINAASVSNRAAIVVAHSCIYPSTPLRYTASFQS